MIKIHSDIKKAMKKRQPIVALESTIITHGMPYPQNVETALACERLIRSNGAVPATIAILNGNITIGLSITELEMLGSSGQSVCKVSRRDLAYVIENKLTGALTVSGTMIAAKMAGIKFLATGGIGGVHRNAEKTFDVSADLEELANTDVYVICSGAKAILDLGKTMEYLETKGVPVIGYQTDVLPAFFTRESDLPVNIRYDSPEDIAKYIITKESLPLPGSVLICNPIPESYSYPKAMIDEAIDKALLDAEKNNIRGKDITPFLLKRVNEITSGRSLEANRKLVYSNCELASKIAVKYQHLVPKK